MHQNLCPRCHQPLVSLDFIEGSKMAKCRHCGAEIETDNIKSEQGKPDTKEASASGEWENGKPPKNSYFFIKNNKNGQLRVDLPQLAEKSDPLSFVILLFPVSFLMILIYILYSIIVASPGEQAINATLAIGAFAIILVWSIIYLINRMFRTEILEIQNGEISLTENNPIPFLNNSTRKYDLSEIKEVKCTSKGKRKSENTQHFIYLSLTQGHDVFFKSETAEGKQWLADYLNVILKNAQAKPT